MVGYVTLNHGILVRIQAPEQILRIFRSFCFRVCDENQLFAAPFVALSVAKGEGGNPSPGTVFR